MAEVSKISRRRKSALSDGGSDYISKRESIIKVAAELFKEKGFKATTLGDIGERAGMDRASVYYYVGSKEELFRESVKGSLDQNVVDAERIAADGSLDPQEKLVGIVEMLMLSYESSYPHMYVYIQEQMYAVGRDPTPWAQAMAKQTRKFEALVNELLDEGIKAGIFRGDVSVKLASNALFGMFNWTHRWFDPDGRQTAKEVSDAFCKIFFDGMSRSRTDA